MVSSRIAIIPARGGSKRIERKNIIDFLGRPMIAWTIEAALESKCFDRVLVSTDDNEIASIARQRGAEVPFLRARNADDQTPVSAATIAALEQAREHWNEDYDLTVQLMPNCPLRGKDEVRNAVVEFESNKREFQISCFKFGWMNPWWAATINSDGQPSRLHEAETFARSQDLPALYCPSGAIWIARSDKLADAGTFYGPGHCFAPMHWIAAVDIDDADDLHMARALGALSGSRSHSND